MEWNTTVCIIEMKIIKMYINEYVILLFKRSEVCISL